MTLHFDQPGLLLLALLIVPLTWFGLRMLSTMDRLRRSVVLLLRSVLVAVLVIMLAGPRTVRSHSNLTVIGILDLSGSVQRFARLPEVSDLDRRSAVEYFRQWFRIATSTRAADDRFGLIVFDGRATVVSVPVRGDYIDDNLDVTVLEGTNIAQAIRLALAMFPADTSKRIVLVSDGNETLDRALEAAAEAAAVPIDVVPIVYALGDDVQVVRVEAPPTAQPGQTVTVRIVLAATAPATGRLVLRREGQPVDINGQAPGASRPVSVPQGRSVHLVQVVLGDSPINRFEAIFEPDDPASDALVDNNRAEAFTSTPGRGSALVLDGRADPQRNALARALVAAGIPTSAQPPTALGGDLLGLQQYDLIILDNVAAYALTPAQHELLARWVNDLGGGLIMVGGPESFGAGGWNGTALEKVLPVELDPPKELKLATAALVLVLDKSGSMNQHVAGTRSTQQRIANDAAAMAIESLHRESLVGVVTFDFFAQVRVPLGPNDDPAGIAERVRGITADGGTNLEPALRRALSMLRGVEAEKKLVVCLTDGRSHTTNLDDIVNAMAAENIKLTTIAVGDDADQETLRHLAEIGGGEFYAVRNPRTLPRVLVDSVQVINTPLLKEGPFVPVIRPTGSTLTAPMRPAPVLEGLVITTPRPDAKVTVEMTHPDGEPLLAHWQAGLGRAAAFTSEADGPWSRNWIGQPGYATFWAGLARTMSRPAMSPDTELVVVIQGDRLLVALEATGRDQAFLDYLHVDGVVYGPDGESRPIRLQQTAPGRYETSVGAAAAGNYVVALSPRRGQRRLAPVIGGASQSASAEFSRFDSDTELLEQIVRATGGQQLDIERPEATDLYDRAGLVPSRSAVPAWRTLLWLALALLLIDVAVRRLAWDSGALRRSAARAVARVTPAQVHGRQAAATLAALRQVEKATRPGGQAPRPAVAEPARPLRSTRPPEPSRVSAAIDALMGRAGKATPSQPKPVPPPPPNTGSTETTSGLLAAKRRARKKLEE